MYVRNSATPARRHQVETGGGKDGYLFGETEHNGKLAFFNGGRAAHLEPREPAGAWNTFEITFKGPELTLWVRQRRRGERLPPWRRRAATSAWRWRGDDIEFRNVKLRTLKP